jgi:hypothetical protein
MDAEDNGQSGYYRTIARAFLERRGAPFVLSPKDQAAIGSWEERRIPLCAVLEGIERAFDGFKARGRGAKGFSLSYCERQVDAAFAQHRDRSAGKRSGKAAAGPGPDKKESARREIEKALRALPPDDAEVSRLLREALDALAGPRPDAAALERIDEGIEAVLWARATAAEKAAAEAELNRELRSRRTGGFEVLVRRQVVKAARAGRRIPHVSLFYY